MFVFRPFCLSTNDLSQEGANLLLHFVSYHAYHKLSVKCLEAITLVLQDTLVTLPTQPYLVTQKIKYM